MKIPLDSRLLTIVLACSIGVCSCDSSHDATRATRDNGNARSPKPATFEASKAVVTPPSVPNAAAAPTAGAPENQYVITEFVEERLAPDGGATATNRIYRGQAVKVYEVRNGWARVSDYYDGRVEGESGQVARWILASSLGPNRPTPTKDLNIPDDPRIVDLPRAPGDGLTERDVLILHAAARYYLESAKAKRIEGGDKSIDKADTYYLIVGPQNKFFRSGDIPDLEGRIRALRQ